ncbi:unnamed protein product [Closterium sp. Naga37s-1]|nr:unnamed protein product [Closterium sp. Naga37s-1]
MAVRGFLLVCIALLLATSALAQRGPPGRGPPGGQQHGAARGGPGGSSPGGTGGPGGPGGPAGPCGPPLNLTVVGNLTADVGARLANCSADPTFLDGHFHLAIFNQGRVTIFPPFTHPPAPPFHPSATLPHFPSARNASGNYNLAVEALLVGATGGPPDSLAIVKGAVCDSSASAAAILALPLAASDWQQRDGWWLLHAEARLDAFLENADAATVDALLALLPNATLPSARGSGGRGSGSGGGSGAGGARSGKGSRRMGRELLMRAAGRVTGAKQGGQQQGAPQPPAGGFSGGYPGAGGAGGMMGGGGVNATVSGYAVLATTTAGGVAWGGQLMGVKLPSTAA